MTYPLRIFVLIGLLFSLSSATLALEVALSFDDAPRPSGVYYRADKRTKVLIEVLKEKGINEAGFFCNTGNFRKTKHRLVQYAKAGHILANHTASHLDLNQSSVSARRFIKSIKNADDKLKMLPNFKRWFRFPFVHQGKTRHKRQQVNQYLKESGYQHGYFTIETQDWYLNSLMRGYLRRGSNFAKLKEIYISVIWDSIQFYDELSQQILGYSPKHIILLHVNDMNALFIGDLIDFLRAKGVDIIDISKAYSDPISDAKWDELPMSQRRITALAKLKGLTNIHSKFENLKTLKRYYQRKIRS